MKFVWCCALFLIAGCEYGEVNSSSMLQTQGTGRTEKLDYPKYKRSEFGSWVDADRDCINTRHELLQSLSTGTNVVFNAKGCSVLRGQWRCPYTGQNFYQASDVDIDHIVPLKWAWERGAYQWPREKRKAFANDPSNLLVVDDSTNQRKGAKGYHDWMPPRSEYHTQYVAKFKYVCKKYGLNGC
jgi:endonuclease I